MADQFALLVADVPLAAGNVDYTDPRITDFRGAMVAISGDYLGEGSSAQVLLALFTKDDGANTSHGHVTTYYRAGSTASSFARHAARTSSGGTDILRVLDPATAGSDWATGTVSDLSNGFRVNWTNVAGLSAGRRVKMVVLLFGGSTMHGGSGSENVAFFTGDTLLQVLALSKRGGFGSLTNDTSIGVGGAAKGSPDEQAEVCLTWPTAANPTTAGEAAGASNLQGRVNSAAGAPTTLEQDALSAFTTTGYSRSSSVVGTFFLGFEWVDDRTPHVELVDLTGSESGPTLLGTGFVGIPEVVVGVFVGATSEDSVVTGAAAQQVGFFFTDGFLVASVSMAMGAGQAVAGGTPTVAFSRFKQGEWNVVSGAGGTALRISSVTVTDGGLLLDFATAKAGRLLLWGVSRIPALEPSAVPVALALPAPTRLVASAQIPTSVHLALALPTPTVVAPKVPSAVALPLVVPAPTVFRPAIPTPEAPPPDLGPLYAEALASLLPRGLAWPRRPVS